MGFFLNRTVITVSLIAVATYAFLCLITLFGLSVREQYCNPGDSGPTQQQQIRKTTVDRANDSLGSVAITKVLGSSSSRDCSYSVLIYLNGIAFLLGGLAFGFSLRPGDSVEQVFLLPTLFVLVGQVFLHTGYLSEVNKILSLPLVFAQTWKGILTYSILSLVGGYLSKY
jgi:hypothetical protein